MINKTDDALQGVNDFLRTMTDRITPNIILIVALFNGFLIGLVTTGYLGGSSVPVKSGTFGLIIWQFVIVCFLTARYVDYTTNYLSKFLICGATGYYWQWQIFAMLWATESFQPPFGDSGFGYILITSVVILSQCFKGNTRNRQGNLYEMPRKENVS